MLREGLWTYEDGQKCHIANMGDGEIISILQLLKRRAKFLRAQAIVLLFVQPLDVPDHAIDREITDLKATAKMSWDDFVDESFNPIIEEATKRELSWDTEEDEAIVLW